MRAVKPFLQSIAAAALLLAAGASPAAAEWAPPALNLETAEEIVAGDTAVDAQGNGLVAWIVKQEGVRVVLARRVGADGALGPVVPLSDPGAGNSGGIEVEMTPGGDAIAVWYQGSFETEVVKARRISAAGTLGPILEIGAAKFTQEPQVAIDSSGFAYVVWIRANGGFYDVEGRAVFADGGLGTTRAFSSGGPSSVSPRVAIGPDQNTLVTWVRSNPESQIQGKLVNGGGAPGGLLEIGGGAKQAQHPSLAARPDGSFVVVFVFGLGAPTFQSLVQRRIVSAAGGLSEIADLSPPGGAQKTSVATAPYGTVTAIWHFTPPAAENRINARRILSDNSSGPLLEGVSSNEGSLSESEIGVDAAGNATVTWSRENPSYEILTRRISAGGTLEPASELVLAAPNAENPREASEPSLGVAANGAALFSFVRRGGGEPLDQIDALRYLAPPDTVPPRITGLRLAPKKFRIAGKAAKRGKAKAAARRKRVPTGSTIRFHASEPLRATFFVARRLPGRRAGKHCVKPGKAPRKAKPCARFAQVKGFRFQRQVASAGKVAIPFNGRVGKRRLKPGNYRLSATGVDAAGNRVPATRRTPFTVVKAGPAKR